MIFLIYFVAANIIWIPVPLDLGNQEKEEIGGNRLCRSDGKMELTLNKLWQ